MLVGLFIIPAGVNAGLFSSLLGDEALADVTTGDSLNNSQNMALLEVNAYSAPVFKESRSAKTSKKESQVSSVGIISDNALVPTFSALHATGGAGAGDTDFFSDQINVYVVRKGDSISQIAEMFDVSTNTILWANDLKKNDKLQEGDILFILPVSGVKHIVTKGQTLGGIAKKYKVDIRTITGFNGIGEDSKIAIGDELIIPEAQMPNDDVPNRAPSSPVVPTYTGALKNLSNYFINPVPDMTRRSQNLHGPGRRGIDLAAPTGTKILASAGGKVLLARKGYNGGYGTMIVIEHPNGTKTLYAHLSKLNTKTSAYVSQGETIGLVGSTGRSTGPHLHFEVFNAKNPGSDWSWAN